MEKNFIVILAMIILFCPTAAWAGNMVNVPMGHWSYSAVELLAQEGLGDTSGLLSKPSTRERMALKISEIMKDIRDKKGDFYLKNSADRKYMEGILSNLIDEFRQELI